MTDLAGETIDSLARDTGFGGAVSVQRAGEPVDREGLRTGRSGSPHPEHGRYPLRDRQRSEGADRARRRLGDRRRDARVRHDGTVAARRRSPPDRRRGDGRAAARAPTWVSETISTKTSTGRSPTTFCRCRCPRTRRHRGLPARARRVSAEVHAGRAVLILQRRLRRTGAAGRAGERVPFHRLVRERVAEPAGMLSTEFLGAPMNCRGCGARLPARRRSRPHQRLPPPGAGERRRGALLDRGRLRTILARTLRGAHPAQGHRGRARAAAKRIGGRPRYRTRVLDSRLVGRARAPETGVSKDSTRACRSAAGTTAERRRPRPSSRTPPTAPGRSPVGSRNSWCIPRPGEPPAVYPGIRCTTKHDEFTCIGHP